MLIIVKKIRENCFLTQALPVAQITFNPVTESKLEVSDEDFV